MTLNRCYGALPCVKMRYVHWGNIQLMVSSTDIQASALVAVIFNPATLMLSYLPDHMLPCCSLSTQDVGLGLYFYLQPEIMPSDSTIIFSVSSAGMQKAFQHLALHCQLTGVMDLVGHLKRHEYNRSLVEIFVKYMEILPVTVVTRKVVPIHPFSATSDKIVDFP